MSKYLKGRLGQGLGMILLAIWLIFIGLMVLISLSFDSSDLIMGILAIGAGALILWGAAQGDWSKQAGRLLLGIWLIITGLVPLLDLSFDNLDLLLAALAIAAGALLLWQLSQGSWTGDLGLLLLALWLVANGLIMLLEAGSDGLDTVMAVVAVAAGTLLLLDR